jgi:putative DNA-invertase from lambdoid prophage Rac
MTSRKLIPNTAENTRRVYGYCRVSTSGQAESGLSIDEQRIRLEARCLENGWTLAHVYVDAGVSGSIPLGKRPQGRGLLAALQAGDTVIASRMDRCFRSAFDALATIEGFKKRKIGLWLLDLGGDVSGNGISELTMTILAAVAQFERGLIRERIKDAKANLRRSRRHQGGNRPFGWQLGEASGHGRSRDLVPDPVEQQVIADIVAMREAGGTLMKIRDAMRARGFAISHQTVANLCQRAAQATTA